MILFPWPPRIRVGGCRGPRSPPPFVSPFCISAATLPDPPRRTNNNRQEAARGVALPSGGKRAEKNMSRSAKDRDGFVVITEVSPKTNQGDPSQTGQTAVPASNKHLQKFFKGEPKALGVSQILNGITQICFGIVCDLGSETFRRYEFPLFLTGVPYWSGLLYIVSGSLSVAAADKPRISLVRGTLVMNTVSAVFSGVAVIIYIIYVCVWDYAGGNRYRSCYYYDRQEESSESEACRRLYQAINIFWAMLFLLLILTVLELCVSISVAVFGCKTLCRTAYSEVSVVIYQTTSPNVVHPPHPDMNVDLQSRPAISETLPP